MSVSLLRLASVAAVVVVLSSCKDSGGGQGLLAPTANAGGDRTAWKGGLVVLDGSGSRDPRGEPLSFAWDQTEGPAVVLTDDRAAQPRFLAPRVGGTLRFRLVVSDTQATSAPDEVIVSVQNRAPYADAGPDRVVPAGDVVALDASASVDADGDPLVATWYQRSGPPVTVATQPNGAATFVAPSYPSVLDFGLVVSDGEATSAENRMRVQVVDESANWPPLANAGPDLDVPRASVVVLSGSALDRESDPLTFVWTQTSGPPVALLGASTLTASFVAPATDADLEFQLVAADAFSTGADRVLVRVRNQAPVITSFVLSPAAPGTADPLVATASVADPDGDPVTLVWEWQRNGTVVAGQTGSTLDPSLTTRGDLFTVRLTATDGLREATAERSVTILDSLPVLTLDAPATVSWGTPATFTVAASDPDGDPVGDVVLLYGPSGMTVSVAGAGSWTPTLPMFDRALDVRFAIGVAGAPTLKSEATIRVVDPDRAYPLRRSGIEIPVWQNGLAVVDADGDGTQELLVAGRTGLYELARTTDGYGPRWMYPFAAGAAGIAAVVAADVTGDGKPEIFFAGASAYGSATGALVELDGVERREVARAARACLDLELGDLDGDGALELACVAGTSSSGSTQRLVVLDAATLAKRWEGPELALGSSIAIGNVDADPALELVAAGGYVFDGATGANEWSYGQAFGSAVATGDLDGDGIEEIVGMDSWNRFRGFSAVLKAPVWEQATFDSDALLVADVDADGVPEIVVGDGQWGNVTAYRYQPATNDLAIVFQLDSQDHGVTSIAVADLDGDGALEIAWGSGATSSGEDVFVVAGRSPAIGVEWKNTNPSQLDGPFVGAKAARTSAGGTPALLFQVANTNSGYDGSRLVRLDPATGDVAVSAEMGTNWSRNAALAVADYDGDGVDEAYAATSSLYDGYLVAWDLGANRAEWSSPAGTGNGRAVTPADLNGDGASELVTVTSEGYVLVYDVKSSTLVWKSTSLGGGVDVEVADVDGDGAPEIVALSTSRLYVFRRTLAGPVAWLESASTAVSGSDLAVADCDGDGVPELFVLDSSYGASVHRFDGALAALGSFAVRGSATSLFVEDLGTARKNLVLGKGDSWAYSGATSSLEAVDPVTGAQIWESPPLWGSPGRNSLSYVDLERDGVRELAFGTGLGMYLTR